MSKRTLGRGLGDLLGSDRGTAPVSSSQPPVTSGLRILIAGAQPPEQSTGAAIETSAPTETEATLPSHGLHLNPLMQIFAAGGLACADLGLLAWTTHYVVTHQHILGFWDAIGCTASVLVAAMCGTAAMCLITVSNKK